MRYDSNFSTFIAHLISSNITKIIIHAYDILYTFSVAWLQQNKNKNKVDNVANTAKGVLELCSMV